MTVGGLGNDPVGRLALYRHTVAAQPLGIVGHALESKGTLKAATDPGAKQGAVVR